MLPREALHLSARSQCLTTDKNQRMKTQQKNHTLCFLAEGLTHFRAENLMARIQWDTAKARGPRKRCAGQTHSPFSGQAAQ